MDAYGGGSDMKFFKKIFVLTWNHGFTQ